MHKSDDQVLIFVYWSCPNGIIALHMYSTTLRQWNKSTKILSDMVKTKVVKNNIMVRF